MTQPTADREHTGPKLVLGRWRAGLVLVVSVTMLAGVLFGYDQGVISGALSGIKADFGLGDTLVEVVTSWVTLGALVGALAAGGLADRFGRRRALQLAGLLFVVGALTQSLTPDTAILVVGRFVVGLGIGVASVAAPLYASELAPPATRGRLVSSYQLAITIGIFLAYIIDARLASGDHWRTMLGIAALPGVALLVATLRAPRSPRWLMKEGDRASARESYVRVRGDGSVDADLDAVQHALDTEEHASWREMFAPRARKALWVGLGLALFQQITGINAVIYYADQIFDLAGFTTPTAQATATTICVGGVNVLATFIAVAYVDRVGRRPLLFTGMTGMFVSLTTLGVAFQFMDVGSASSGGDTGGGGSIELALVTMGCLIVFISSFAFSLGPIVWTIINEIYPDRIRGRSVALATAVNWGSAFLVSQFFLTMVDDISTAGAFWVFAGTTAIGMVWIWRRVPETKGLDLDDVPAIWTADDPVAEAADLQRRVAARTS
ncbi:MAG: sugar porter family MFS transporter [Acidimicrobiia bacterium]|nr:sugar porter family MFS transporter [Acidimicrobiia bacterium]